LEPSRGIGCGPQRSSELCRVRVLLKRLRVDAVRPEYMTESAAGMDLSAALDAEEVLAPGQRKAIGTGWAIAIPGGFEAQVRPRSGRALRDGLTIVNAPGTIDSDYRGEIKVLLINLGGEPVTIRSGDRIAQLVVAPVSRAELTEVGALPTSARG